MAARTPHAVLVHRRAPRAADFRLLRKSGSGLRPFLFTLGMLTTFVGTTGCNTAYKRSIGAETERVFSRIFFTDFNTAWQSVLDALKNSRLDISNREGGFIQTKFTDNTSEKNFVDSFGGADSYLKAQFRFRVSVSRGAAATYNGRPVIKLSVRKEQLIQRDVLEGWKPIETDAIEENTLLYRIGRIIEMRGKMSKAEERATEQDVESLGF